MVGQRDTWRLDASQCTWVIAATAIFARAVKLTAGVKLEDDSYTGWDGAGPLGNGQN
jgi:hypothetical protein